MTECIALLMDELSDHLASLKGKQPIWSLTSESVARGFAVSIVIGGDVVAESFGRSLGSAHRRALDAFRAWSDDQPSEIANALEVSLESAQAERAAT